MSQTEAVPKRATRTGRGPTAKNGQEVVPTASSVGRIRHGRLQPVREGTWSASLSRAVEKRRAEVIGAGTRPL